jgi:predicted helicase
MSAAIENIRTKLPRILKDGTERTLYPELCPFIVAVANEEPVNKKGVEASAEESSTQHESGVGFPDITVRHGKEIAGWIEVKLPGKALDHQSYVQQFLKYKSSLENVIFTNLQEWELWQWDRSDKEKPKRIKRIVFDLTHGDSEENQKDFLDMLIHFFEYQPTLAKTPKQLALALARKTRLLSQQVEEAVKMAEKEEEKENELLKLKNLFEKTLIQDLDVHQFANMVAETVAYSLFLSRLEHEERGKEKDFTLTTANDYIPESIPILSDLYQLISKVSKQFPSIHNAALVLLEQLNRADMMKIRTKLVEHKVGEDPVIQFYEPFLTEFDPIERKRRGVYYTPKPVVDFIIRGVDYLLREKFGKTEGLANESVHILDPATGTGTFLLSAIQQVNATMRERNEGLGDEISQKEFKRLAADHILQHFYGFELLAAPYAIAHLKLTLEMERLGFDFEQTKKDTNSDNDRFKVYLANTLDDPEQPPKLDLPGYHLAAETNKASAVKRQAPILAIIGNPPYAGHSFNNSWFKDEKGKKKATFIGKLVQDYYFVDGKPLGEKNPKWLQDDYVKFIRFAQWRIEQTGEGIIAFITSNGFLDNPTFRGMRQSLLKEFKDIYILDLHGSTKKKEMAPDGSLDKNVFNIQQGVCISFFIKHPDNNKPSTVHHAEIWGSKEAKFIELLEHDISNIEWNIISPQSPRYLLVPQDTKLLDEYEKNLKITDAMPLNVLGFQTHRDEFAIHFDKSEIEERIRNFQNLEVDDTTFQKMYQLEPSNSWNISKARKKIRESIDTYGKIITCLYRPFDNRWCYFDQTIMDRPRRELIDHVMNKENLCLGLGRQGSAVNDPIWSLLCISQHPTDANVFRRGGVNLFSLYLYSNTNNGNGQMRMELGGGMKREPNFSKNFITETEKLLMMEFIPNGRGDLKKTLGPEDLLYYIYAVFQSPTYRKRYKEFLKNDFPRIPITKNRDLFIALIEKGSELVNLHLLGKNPFSDSKTIFDDTKKWRVLAGGKCPTSLDDWKITDARYEKAEKRICVNNGQYFEGIEPEVWEFYIGGYQVLEKWLKERGKADRSLSVDDLKHYMKIIVSLRETIRLMQEIDETIDAHGGWPLA